MGHCKVKYPLREYQSQLLHDVFLLWSQDRVRRVLAQLPTGGGKTVIFASAAGQFTDRGHPVLVLAHREELLLQAKEKLEHVTGQAVGLIKAGYAEDRSALIQVASVASLANRALPPAALAIVDEAHHSAAQSYQQLLQQYPSAYILGVTATPARLDGRGFKDIYDRLVLGPTVRWAIDRGYLSPFKLFAAPKTVNTQGVKRTAGDYNARQLARAVDTSLVAGDLIEAWRTFAPGKKTVVFAVNVEHSMAIARAYSEAGIPAEHLDGETLDRDRKAVLERFKAGETVILSNCGLFAEGFDLPSVEAVQCVRPTQSLTFWLQMVGRSLRPHPGKDYAVIIDHTENWIVHGTPDRPRHWSLEPVTLDGGRWNVVCPNCQHVFRPLPEEQQPASYEWSPEHQEFRLVCRYTCPHCCEPLEVEKWEGQGDPPLPRGLQTDRAAEIWEIPLDCDLEILADLYRLVGFQRRAKRHFTLQWLERAMVQQYPHIGEPELRECALLMGLDEAWARQWASLAFEKLQLSRTPKPSPSQPVKTSPKTSDVAAPDRPSSPVKIVPQLPNFLSRSATD